MQREGSGGEQGTHLECAHVTDLISVDAPPRHRDEVDRRHRAEEGSRGTRDHRAVSARDISDEELHQGVRDPDPELQPEEEDHHAPQLWDRERLSQVRERRAQERLGAPLTGGGLAPCPGVLSGHPEDQHRTEESHRRDRTEDSLYTHLRGEDSPQERSDHRAQRDRCLQ